MERRVVITVDSTPHRRARFGVQAPSEPADTLGMVLRSVRASVGLNWAPAWALVAVVVLDVAVVWRSGDGLGPLAPPMAGPGPTGSPTGELIEDEGGVRIVMTGTEAWKASMRPDVRRLAVLSTGGENERYGLLLECARAERLGMHVSVRGPVAVGETELRAMYGAAIATRGYAHSGERMREYGERVARGDERWWHISWWACAHDLAVAWVGLVLCGRVLKVSRAPRAAHALRQPRTQEGGVSEP
jgi:hypothetical protein